jgi:hypothetical protein
MPPKNHLLIPKKLIVLNMLGAILVGLGLMRHIAGIDVLPAALRFENYGLTLFVVGQTLTIPLLRHIIGLIREKSDHPKS